MQTFISEQRLKDVASVGNSTTVLNCPAWRGMHRAGCGLHLLTSCTATSHCMLSGAGKRFEIRVSWWGREPVNVGAARVEGQGQKHCCGLLWASTAPWRGLEQYLEMLGKLRRSLLGVWDVFCAKWALFQRGSWQSKGIADFALMALCKATLYVPFFHVAVCIVSET